jgi:23S rRNA pseudouridine1911/1915/1917 synthase
MPICLYFFQKKNYEANTGTSGRLAVEGNSLKFELIYEDNHCLAVGKPARMLTVSDESGDETLLTLVRAYNSSRQQPGKKGYVAPVHMLDRPVSGLVVFAASSKAAARLSDLFRSRNMEKIYLAVVEGTPRAPEEELVDYLVKDRDSNNTKVVSANTKDAKKCVLSYRLLRSHNGFSLLAVRPETGRSHQIRVQLANAGTIIYGDRRYGSQADFDGAIALHALRLKFPHPVTKENIALYCAPPSNWQKLMPGDFDV